MPQNSPQRSDFELVAPIVVHSKYIVEKYFAGAANRAA